MLEVSPSGKYFVSVVRTAPKLVWIWFGIDLEKPVLVAVIAHTGPVRDVKWDDAGLNLIISYISLNRDYISVWNSSLQTPKPLHEEAIDLQLRGAQWVSASKTVLMWTSDEFMVCPLADNSGGGNSTLDADNPVMEEESPSSPIDRLGSPQHLQNDDTAVRDLVNGVQQQEWGEPTNYQLEDTFHKLNLKK
jgi:WD40 repeat protein